MISMLRSELYRIVKSRLAWGYAIMLTLMVLATPFAVWLHDVWPAFAETGFVELPDPEHPLHQLQILGVSIVGGGLLSMGVSVVFSALVTDDFKGDFVKNLLQARGGRVSYAVSLMISCLIFTAVSVAFSMVVVSIAFRVVGYEAAPSSFADMAQWYAQVVLVVLAYASLTALVAIATRSEAAGIITGVFLGGGAIESVLKMVLANLPGLPEAIRDCLDGYLAVNVATLSNGTLCDPMTYTQAGITFLVAAVLCVLVMRRKSLD